MNNLTVQQLKALNLSKHTLVTANAGSGKTFILTKRFIETIRQKKIKYNQIVAITFTEKASAELLSRISNEIDEFLRNPHSNISDFDLIRIREFREHILSAKISTIHSFCFDLLKEFPVEAGIDPSTEILDELNKRELIERSIEDTLIENIDNPNVKEILRIFGKEKTIKQLKTLIEKRYFTDQLIEKIYSNNNQYDFEAYFYYIYETAKLYFKAYYFDKFKSARELLPFIKDEITLKNKEELVASINDLEKVFDKFLNELDFELLYLIFQSIISILLTQKFEVRKRTFSSANENSAITLFQKIIVEVKDLFNSVKWDKETEKEKYNLSLTLIELYNKSKEKFHQFKTLEGVLDFDDLLILTDKLLDNENIIKELRKRFLFILVDEFQDTDTIQFNIIKKIAGNFESENNVFVVGDEKQSIYGFRNAQLSVFQDYKNYLREQNQKLKNAEVVTLSTSYRSAPSIAAFVNLIFSNLWKDFNFNENKINFHQEVEYSPLQIGREKFSDEPVVFLVSDDTENQNQKVADYILYLISSGKEIFDKKEERFRKIDFGDIALLFRTRLEIKEFENSFIEKNIPFVVSGGRGYYQSEEIQDWISYLLFLSNYRNDDALLSILRSPFFALSDNQILEISFQEGNSFYEKLANYCKLKQPALVNEVFEILTKHINAASRYTIPELIQTILRDTHYYGKIDFHPKKSQMIANIEKLINVAHNFETKGLEDLKSFTKYLKEALENEDSPEAIISEIKGSVQLMTMHQAKGLEFPIVILPNFEKGLQKSSVKFGELAINDYFGFCYKLSEEEGNNIHTLSSFFGNKINEGIVYNEQLRLLYVSLTRATEKLVISFSLNEEKSQENQNCFKKILLDHLPNFNFEQNNSKSIKTNLTYLRKQKDNFIEVEENYELTIDIIKELPNLKEENLTPNDDSKKHSYDLRVFTESIKDKVKEEIFTATQINTYQFCPFKYLLKFIIGYKPSKDYISETSEDDFISGAEVGLIFHQLMEKLSNPDLNEAEEILTQILEPYPETISQVLKEVVFQKLSQLINHKIFLDIFSNKNAFREFEIRLKFHNHLFLGVIDRININDSEITIIDYKTDTFDEKELNKKIEEYKTQMEFYVLLVSEYFKQKEKINLILYFVNHPDKSEIRTYNQIEIENIRNKFLEILSQIENGNFQKNISMCKQCEYSKNQECIIN